jgi:Family of unknown function (DUF6495)
MKYRRLTTDELSGLDKKFIQFLIVNGIDATDWDRIKRRDPARAEHLLDTFSDVVFEETLTKITFLQFRDKHEWRVYSCGETGMVLMGLVSDNEDFDFRKVTAINQLGSTEGVKCYRAEKKYKPIGREGELFEMLEKGCTITDGLLFGILEKLVTARN